MAEFTGERIKVEHAFHVGEKREARRKLIERRVKAVMAAGTIAAASYLGINAAENLAHAENKPDSYYSGNIEIVMSDYLNVRTEPNIISTPGEATQNDGPNTIDWENVQQVNGVDVTGGKSITIENPLITKGESPEGQGFQGLWVTFDAKVNNGLTSEDEKLYVSLGSATSEYVKSVKPGSIVDLQTSIQPQDSLGKVTVNP